MRFLYLLPALALGSPFFGTSRSPAHRHARALEGDDVRPVTSQLDFTGPIHGMGFVEHSHAAVFHDDILFLDEWTDVITSLACEAVASREERPNYDSRMLMPDEEKALRKARSFTLTMTDFPADFERELPSVLYVVPGQAAMTVCPALSEFTTFSLTAFSSSSPSIVLTPAPLLAAFKGVQWHHRVNPDIDAALAARNETGEHYPAFAAERALAEIRVSIPPDINANWNYATNSPTTRSIQLGSGVTCEDCFAYFRHAFVFDLEYCAFAKWVSFGWQMDSGLHGTCNQNDRETFNNRKIKTIGSFRLLLSARYEASAGIGATFRGSFNGVTSSGSPSTYQILPRTTFSTVSFSIAGIPVSVAISAGLSTRMSLSGKLDVDFSAGRQLQASIAFGITYTSSGGLNFFRTVNWSPKEISPTFFIRSSGGASMRLELVPSLTMKLFNIVGVTAQLPLRLQNDIGYVAPDAVICDIPLCASNNLALYVTWQPLFVLSVESLRLSDLIGKIPVVGGVINYALRDIVRMELWPARTLIQSAILSRNRIYSVCVPKSPATAWIGVPIFGSSGSSNLQVSCDRSIKNPFYDASLPKRALALVTTHASPARRLNDDIPVYEISAVVYLNLTLRGVSLPPTAVKQNILSESIQLSVLASNGASNVTVANLAGSSDAVSMRIVWRTSSFFSGSASYENQTGLTESDLTDLNLFITAAVDTTVNFFKGFLTGIAVSGYAIPNIDCSDQSPQFQLLQICDEWRGNSTGRSLLSKTTKFFLVVDRVLDSKGGDPVNLATASGSATAAAADVADATTVGSVALDTPVEVVMDAPATAAAAAAAPSVSAPSANNEAIIGGVVGGVVGLAIIIALTARLYRYRSTSLTIRNTSKAPAAVSETSAVSAEASTASFPTASSDRTPAPVATITVTSGDNVADAAMDANAFAALAARGDEAAITAALNMNPSLALERTTHSHTALIVAARYSKDAIISLLVNRGADIAAVDKNGRESLMARGREE